MRLLFSLSAAWQYQGHCTLEYSIGYGGGGVIWHVWCRCIAVSGLYPTAPLRGSRLWPGVTCGQACALRYKLSAAVLVVLLAVVILCIETSGGFETFYTLLLGALRSLSWFTALYVLHTEWLHGLPDTWPLPVFFLTACASELLGFILYLQQVSTR
jgi:hypothetical protein